MQFSNLSRRSYLIFVILFSGILNSCKKSNTDHTGTLSTEEYIHYTVNGISYNYDMPADSVLADYTEESQTFLPVSSVIAQRIPGTASDFTRIGYYKNDSAPGSLQRLTIFATPQTEIYPYTATSATPIFVSILEYGSVGEFISGSFSALLISAAPGSFQYNVTCNFRVMRRI